MRWAGLGESKARMEGRSGKQCQISQIPWWLGAACALAQGRDAKKSGGGGVGKGTGVTRGAMLDWGSKKGKERARGDSGVEQEERG